jgi:hypothetical protein
LESWEAAPFFQALPKPDSFLATQNEAAVDAVPAMSHSMKSNFVIALTALACLALLYFIYSLLWFVFVGRRKQQHRVNIFTGLGFAAVVVATGLWFLVASAVFESAFALERIVLVASVGLCVFAMVMARSGSIRTALPIMVVALVVALNSIGAVYAQ